jgi:acyl carrier protein phosphodiesterase
LNYLAHFHLSYGNDDLLVGALLGDFVKGPLTGERKKGLEQGILLHRKIDAFTDQHSTQRNIQQLLDPRYRRFAGIMTDIIFDHFLSLHWQQFHPQSLHAFSRELFDLLSNNSHLPAAAQQQADNLMHYNVLVNFQYWPTVDAALNRVSQRLQRDNPLGDAADELNKHYGELEQQFLAFYPELQQRAQQIRAEFSTD